MEVETVIVPALLGAAGGAAYGGSVYMKKRAQSGAKFKFKRFAGTCFAGAVVGSYAFVYDGVSDPVKLAAYSGMVTVVAENLFKFVDALTGKKKK